MNLRDTIADMKIDTAHMIEGCQRDEAIGYNHAIDDVLQTLDFIESVENQINKL